MSKSAVFSAAGWADHRFQDLLEAAPDGILEADHRRRIVLVNRAAETMFGYRRDELLGQPVEVLIPDSLGEVHGRHGSDLALRGRRKDGSLFPVEISLGPVASQDGPHAITIIREVSERKGAEARIRAVQEHRTQKLESRNREIERADQLKTEFLTNMSHELRSPLHTIIGFADLLAEEVAGPLSEKQQRFVGHIHNDSLHLLDLINDLLDLSKIEAGQIELQCQAFDMGAALEEALASVRSRATLKSIEIHTGAMLPLAVFADPLRLKQILDNLLSNALKFTPAGGKVWVEATGHDGFAEISVTDTGIGIAEDQNQAVFDKFYQVSAATKGGYEGTGLGLAISKRLVEQHGGRMWLRSEPGNGSCFTFTIPLEQPSARYDPNSPCQERQAQPPVPPGP